MKKLGILLLLLIALSLVAYFLISKDQQRKSSVDTKDRDFAVENIDDVYKIFIAPRNADPLTLTRSEDHWLINGKHRAGKSQMSNILGAISKVSIDYIPHKNAVPTIIRDIGLVGVKVEVYDKNDNNLKTYYIGNDAPSMRATNYLMEGHSQPYCVRLKGFEGGLRGRFTNTAREMRSKIFISEKPSDIAKISLEIPRKQSQSFVLTNNDGTYDVDPFHPLTKKINKPVNQSIANAYIYGFEKVACEFIDNDNVGRDTIVQKTPFAVLSIERTDGQEKSMKIYSVNELVNGEGNAKDLESLNLVGRLFAECSWGDFLLIQLPLFKKLLRPYDHFFE